jgi:hypothetical protein
MTHREIIVRLSKWLKKHDQNTIIPNCNTIASEITSNTSNREIPDVIGWCYWASVLIEVKTSRSDFLRDFKKPFRKLINLGMGEFKYYCCPTDLLTVEDMPEYWGLLYCDEKGKITIVKVAKKHQANLMCERTLLLSINRRSKIKKS